MPLASQGSHQNWWIHQQLTDKKEGSSYVTDINWKSMSACLEGRIPDAWDRAGFKAAQALRDNDPHEKVHAAQATPHVEPHARTHARTLARTQARTHARSRAHPFLRTE